MADYQVTHVIWLTGATRSGNDSLSWTGTFDQQNSRTITDRDPVGVLDQTDSIASGNVFSGFYIEISGRLYGVFQTGDLLTVPYNKDEFDISGHANLSAGTTTNYATTLSNAANCFLTGTRIDTPNGARAIETLAPGDAILTADGHITQVVWVWRQDVVSIRGLDPARAPVCISADALGPGCPTHDLTVTADHALLVDGMLVNAGALVNHTTIRSLTPDQMPPRFSLWHIETGAHEMILAQGCAAETFLDYTGRAGFDSHAAYLARHGTERLIAELPLLRICTARHLPPALRARLGITRAA